MCMYYGYLVINFYSGNTCTFYTYMYAYMPTIIGVFLISCLLNHKELTAVPRLALYQLSLFVLINMELT
jgi:hypothetical protein